jgi:flavin-dependent dehydrogenase
MTRKISVIGAGLAGLYAAWSAASHGADVELYEKGTIGTKRNCGELFTEVYTSAPEECKLNRIKTFRFIVGDKVTNLEFGETSPFIMTDKCKHELIMKKRCEDLGVVIKEKTKVIEKFVLQDRKNIYAIGTSGYNFSMGKAVTYIAKRNPIYNNEDGTLTGVDLDDNSIAVFDIRNDLMGYKWFFPKGKNLCNMGEGVYDYKFKTELLKSMNKTILYSGGGLIPMPTMSEFYSILTYNGGEIKVGNAAGLVNPLLGGGNHLAAISGILAGEMLAKNVENKYYQALMEIIGDEMRIGISAYELMRKLDIDSVSKLIELKFIEQIDHTGLNKQLRRTIRKWVHLPEVTSNDLENFLEE